MQISELTLHTADLNSIKEFYTNTLSLRIIFESQEEISFHIGNTILTFRKSNSNENPFYHFAFNIPSNKLDEAQEWMRGKEDLLLISENNFVADFVNWNAKSIYFLDPAGNIVEFIARFDLKNETQSEFNSSQILNISEIGIVTDDVPGLRKKLIDEYKVFDFIKSVNSETFSAMGDDNGLFIIAVENRNWYPTQTPSQKYPFEIKFINDEGEQFDLTDKIM